MPQPQNETSHSHATETPPETPTGTPLHFHEGSIDLPDGFEDRTANLFVPANPQSQPNLSIARDTLKEGETLDQYITRQLGVLKSRLAGHKVLQRRSVLLGREESDLAGEQIDAQYKNGGLTVHQRQAAFLIAPQRALIFTASSPHPFDEALEHLWRQWLASFSPRPAAEPSDEPSTEPPTQT
jgi:hypothetical protein